MKSIMNVFGKLILGTQTMFKELFNKKTYKRQLANILTFSRLIFAPIVLILILFNQYIAALVITIIGAITDWFDGKIARAANSTSDYGRLLDQIADKLFTLIIGVNVALHNNLFFINLIAELFIAAINFIYINKYPYIKVKSSMFGRIKQWPLGLALALGILSIITDKMSLFVDILIIITFIFQLLTCISYIKSNEKEKASK